MMYEKLEMTETKAPKVVVKLPPKEKIGIKKSKVVAKAPFKSRKPFVLVLVDDHGKSFHESLIKAGDPGGDLAAQHINAAVEERMHKLPNSSGNYDIVVRVYASVNVLRKTLGPKDSISLDRFIDSFNAFHALFHYNNVSPVMKKIQKVKQTFKQSLDDSQCKHIFFFGGHPYYELLRSSIKRTDRVTLVASTYLDSEPCLLGLNSFAFEKVFRVQKPKECPHYKKGKCYWGKKCRMFHPPAQSLTAQSPPPPNSGIKLDRPDHPKTSPNLQNPNLIPLNASSHRLDTHLFISKATLDALYAKAGAHGNPCPDLHFRGACNAPTCPLDHDPLTPELLDEMRYCERKQECDMRGACRSITCLKGHASLTGDREVTEWGMPDRVEGPEGVDWNPPDRKPRNLVDLLSGEDCCVEMAGEGPLDTWDLQGEDLIFFGDVEDVENGGEGVERVDKGVVESKVGEVGKEAGMAYDITMKFALSGKEAGELDRRMRSRGCLDPPQW
ncbi:uncharacterized protein BDZ99DRAFT_203398 [Mytilinidion resinicola]|uniref:C3H1-type domain-containing protein n=1 Tax=Mytilinidion resinicola TaxID=574789 RepID=A0A6A6Y1N2_9PEZI|nr:uncharacterized protein BDZ99DRAFT_203398 [Mytilinidion resinicola]KAF2802423.1 hypothetical protein BDZ99DRAFT_203398 [Mytilinidion resinicola]